MSNIDRISSSHKLENPEPIPCSTIAAFVGGTVIFGVLAGLALWKGGGLSFKNAKFSYLGFGALGAGSISLSIAAGLAIYTKCVLSKKSTALDASKGRRGFTSFVPPAAIGTTTFGNYTGKEIEQILGDLNGQIEEQFENNLDLLKSVILYLLCTTKGQWTRNWHISPENLPAEALYTAEFIEHYLIHNRENKNTLKEMNPEVSAKFVNYIINKTDEREVNVTDEGLTKEQMLSLIPPYLWPQDREMSADYIDSQIGNLMANHKIGPAPIADFQFSFDSENEKFKRAILDRLFYLQETNNLGLFPSLSAIKERDLPPINEYDYSDAFMAAYLTAKVNLENVTDEVLRTKFVNYIIHHKNDLLSRINPQFWPADREFTQEFLASQVNSNFASQKGPFKNAMIAYIIKHQQNDAGLISLEDWPAGVGFLPAFLNKQLEGRDYKLDPQRRDFNAMIAHIIRDRNQFAHLIEASNLPEGQQYSDLFKRNYLKEITPEKLAKVPTPLREKFIRFMIEKQLESITAIPIDQWPEELLFTTKYLKGLSDLEGFTLTEEQPARFRNAVIDYIMNDEPKKAHLIAPSQLPVHGNYTNSFMCCYLTKSLLTSADLENLQESIRQKFIHYINMHAPHLAALVNPAWLEAAPSVPFIECSLAGNPDLEKMHPDVKRAFEEHRIKDPLAIVAEISSANLVRFNRIQLILKCRDEVAQGLLMQLTSQDIGLLRNHKILKLIAPRLPKYEGYLPPSDVFKLLWENQGDDFASWIANDGRFNQKPLIDFLYGNLNQSTKRQAQDSTLKLLGFQIQSGMSMNIRDAEITQYREMLLALPAEKLPTIIVDSFKLGKISIPSERSNR